MEYVTPITEEAVSDALRVKLARYFGLMVEDIFIYEEEE